MVDFKLSNDSEHKAGEVPDRQSHESVGESAESRISAALTVLGGLDTSALLEGRDRGLVDSCQRHFSRMGGLPSQSGSLEMTFFWGADNPLSNWYQAPFSVKGVRFCNNEQFMMYCKAKLFGDDECATKILSAKAPKEHKVLGRAVRGFVDAIWNEKCEHYVYVGSLAKFQQNPILADFLLETHGTELVEASPYDRIWGVGLSASDPRINDKKLWRGENKLGNVQMQVRNEILALRLESLLRDISVKDNVLSAVKKDVIGENKELAMSSNLITNPTNASRLEAGGLLTFDSLAAENELLRAALFGKHGVRSGLDIIEKCLVKATQADHSDAPFPYDPEQAAIYHRAQQDAYRHTLEMVSLPENLGMLADKENPAAAVLLRAALTYIESPEKDGPQQQMDNRNPEPVTADDIRRERERIARWDEAAAIIERQGGAIAKPKDAAALHPDADFSAAVAGHLKENGALHFPGESLVSACTIIEQHDVYGRANEASIPGFVLLFPGETEEAAAEMLSMLKSGGNTVFPVAAESAAALLEGISDGPWTRGQQWERVYNFSESEQDVANATWKLLNEYGFDPDWEMGTLEPGGDYRYAIELPQHEVAKLRDLQTLDSAIFPVNMPLQSVAAVVDASAGAGAGYALAFLDEPLAVADELLESLRAGGVSVYRAAAGEAAMILAEVAECSGLEPEYFDSKG